MAGGVLQSSLTSHLNEMTPQIVVSTVERKQVLYNLFEKRPAAGGDAYQWRYNNTGNTSATSYGDGDAESAAVAQSYVEANSGWRGHRVTYRIEKAAIENAGGNAYVIGDLAANELRRGAGDLMNDIEDALRSDGTGNSSKDVQGIQTYVVGSGSPAGISISTYTNWSATVTAVSGQLTTALMDTILATLRGPTKNAQTTIGLVNQTLFNIVGNLFDATTHPVGQDAPADLRLVGGFRHVAYAGVEFLEVPGYTSQRVDYLDTNDWHIRVMRDFTTEPWERDGDALTTVTTWRGALVCERPFAQGAHTSVTS